MDYPYDEEEEYRMAYADEMEMLMEMEEECTNPKVGIRPKSKRSLDFSSPLKQSDSSSQPAAASVVSPVKDTATLLADTEIPLEIEEQILNADERKRKVEQLFGDILDIEDEETLGSTVSYKRSRPTNMTDADEQIIEKIMTGRQKQLNQTKSRNILASSQQSAGDEVKELSISKRVPKWPFITVTTSDADRYYIRLHSEEKFNRQIEAIGTRGHCFGLLSVAFETVRKEAEMYIRNKLDREEAEKFESKLRALEDTGTDSGVETAGEEEDTAELWVDKYKPKSYIELFSDESTNRTLLHWLKLWDKIVFNREPKLKRKIKEERKPKKYFNENRFQKKNAQEQEADDLDENGCPHYKMALLCGPPGLGKTTLAHMVARQAGYNVVELNASDDRSPETFRNQLEAATQMRAVMGEQPRPNCLVLDEIDGAPAASIEVLVKFATGKDVGKKRGKKKIKPVILKRPIICICNDVYVPALRPLRQMALVIHFPPTASARLAQRLQDICRKQKIKTSLGALTALAEKTRNDIRMCLSVLHFFKAQGKEVRLSDIQKSTVGLKDIQKGLFAVWQEIFQIQRLKRKLVETKKQEGKLEPMPDLDSPEMMFGDNSKEARMKNIIHTVQSFGDYERVAQGVFENYLNMNLKEGYPQLKKIADSLDWFCMFDFMNCFIQTNQSYVLMPYLPYAFAFWHFTFATTSWPKITYPNAGYEASVREARNRQLLTDMMQGMAVKVRARCQQDSLLLDTLPYLLRIIVPRLRPVNIQLYSKKEKEELENIVSIMIDYNLNYIQERTPVGAYEYNFDPNMAEVVYFKDQKPNRTLSYNMKQLIAREIEMEKMRRAETKLVGHNENAGEQKKAAQVASSPADKKAAPAIPNHLQFLKPKAITAPDAKVVKDFFGRQVQTSSGTSKTVRSDEIVKSDVWFHFKEGFSNAVRRHVKMQDLV